MADMQIYSLCLSFSLSLSLSPHLPQGYTVPAGHLLMLSPYWSHRDAEKFPDPEKYNPVCAFHSASSSANEP